MARRLNQDLQDFGLALVLSLVFLVGSFARVIGDAGSAAFGGKIIDATLSQPLWGTALAGHLAYFAIALLLAHIALAIACYGLGRISFHAWPSLQASARPWILLWFLLLTTWILTANATWYPSSSLGAPYADLAAVHWHGIRPIDAVGAVISLLFVAASIGAVARWKQGITPVQKKSAIAVVVASAASGLVAFSHSSAPGFTPSSDRPHVILIGLDSLRTDAVTGDGLTRAPTVKEFLAGSTVFSDTLTPLARTFPAWVSIISGRHPHSTGAVINLFPRDQIHEGDTLPEILRKAGYKTVYAIDEVRFSNLDQTYGFDEMISPPIGSADFLLGFFTDTPLSNLIVNTRVGAVLFPYAHGNRAAATTYDPDTYIKRLDRTLDFDRPTFLAVHMTLGHWPYTWSTSESLLGEDGRPDSKQMYAQAVARLDAQFNDLLGVLRRRGALDNAIVVLLSDHGESLGEPEHAHIPQGSTEAAYSEIYGHGTNIFAEQQYRVLLGMRTFGNTPLPTRPGLVVEQPASLEDIAPTLVDALGLHPETPFDGISLVPLMQPESGVNADLLRSRIRFTETEFNPPGVALGQTISASALRGAAEYYRIDPDTDRILIRQEFLGDILANRQYAASRNGSMLASIPMPDGPGHYLAYFDRPESQPRWLDSATAASGGPEVSELWAALTQRFPSTRRPAKVPAAE